MVGSLLDISHVLIVATAGVVLAVMYHRGMRRAQLALDWCKQQRVWIGSRGTSAAVKPSPHPVGERIQLLEKMRHTALPEGDLGSFLLRREDVSGQHDASSCANLLVSLALFFTILGLIGTLWSLGLALQASSHTAPAAAAGVAASAPADLLDQIMTRVQEPLGRLPWLFIPPGLGLLLAVFAGNRQRVVDEELERTWHEVDTFTETELLPRYLPKRDQEQSASLERLADSSQQFANASVRLQETYATLDQALEKLGDLNQSSWARELRQAAEEFRSRIDESGAALGEATRAISDNLGNLPAVARSFDDAASSIAGAGTHLETAVRSATGVLAQASNGLSGALHQTGETLQQVVESQRRIVEAQSGFQELTAEVSGLSLGMGALNHSFTNWSSTQQEQMKDLRKLLGELREEVATTAEQWRSASEHVRLNAGVVREGLDKACAGFEAASGKLGGILDEQQRTFATMGSQVAVSLREGHERFLAATRDQFDHGDGLYDRLDTLKLTMEHAGGRLNGLDSRLERLPTVITGYQNELLASRDAVAELSSTLSTLGKVVAERDARWEERLLVARRETDQQLEKTLNRMGTIMDTRMGQLNAIVERLEHQNGARPCLWQRLFRRKH